MLELQPTLLVVELPVENRVPAAAITCRATIPVL